MLEAVGALPVGRRYRISVALCTYNGERYLGRQLASILQQTRLPDELVVCDDGSSDDSVLIVRAFAERAPFPVHVHVNERNLQSTRNFEQAIHLCTGDLIALCDQDDLWYPNRLARSEEVFLRNPGTGLMFSDADLMDENDALLKGRLWPTFSFQGSRIRQLRQGDYTLCVRSRFITGATVMFRAELRKAVLPVRPGWIHDEWIAASVPLFAELVPVEEALIRYRRHALQQVGPVTVRSLRALAGLVRQMLMLGRVDGLDHWGVLQRTVTATLNFCDAYAETPLTDEGRSRLVEYAAFAEFAAFRLALPGGRMERVGPVLRHLHLYRGFEDWREVAKDLFLSREAPG